MTISRFRRDGWTPARQLRFLDALVRTRSVTGAAAAAGMSRESAYRLRNRDPKGLFAAAWDRALEGPALSLSKGHKLVNLSSRRRSRQRPGLQWNSIKGHQMDDTWFSIIAPASS
jgi:hypothetical protein